MLENVTNYFFLKQFFSIKLRTHVQFQSFSHSKHEAMKIDYLMNGHTRGCPIYYLSAQFCIKNSFCSYIFVQPLMIFGLVFTVVSRRITCLITFKFISVAQRIQIQMFKKRTTEPNVMKIHTHIYRRKKRESEKIPLWLVIEYFITCIGYSKKLSFREKNLFYICLGFMVVSFRDG